jgi:hypothetical protein
MKQYGHFTHKLSIKLQTKLRKDRHDMAYMLYRLIRKPCALMIWKLRTLTKIESCQNLGTLEVFNPN